MTTWMYGGFAFWKKPNTFDETWKCMYVRVEKFDPLRVETHSERVREEKLDPMDWSAANKRRLQG
jgi:hypothetical protein